MALRMLFLELQDLSGLDVSSHIVAISMQAMINIINVLIFPATNIITIKIKTIDATRLRINEAIPKQEWSNGNRGGVDII